MSRSLICSCNTVTISSTDNWAAHRFSELPDKLKISGFAHCYTILAPIMIKGILEEVGIKVLPLFMYVLRRIRVASCTESRGRVFQVLQRSHMLSFKGQKKTPQN